MARNRLLVQVKRLRRRIWPAEPGSSRSALYDVSFGLVLLICLVRRFPDWEYSYLIQAARSPAYRASGILAWFVLFTSLVFARKRS
jgi:hypothetical protein